MIEVKNGQPEIREVVIRGDEATLRKLAAVLDYHLTWSDHEDVNDAPVAGKLPEGFFQNLFDALNGDLED